MKFCWATLHVKNMKESLAFYEEILGLEISQRFNAGPGMEIVFLGDGETRVELIHSEMDQDINMGKDISLGFEVDSLDETIELIKRKEIKIHSGPFEPNPSTKFFFVLDPNGLKIQFVEHTKQ